MCAPMCGLPACVACASRKCLHRPVLQYCTPHTSACTAVLHTSHTSPAGAAPRPSHGAPANIPADLYAAGGLGDAVLLDLAVLLVQQTSLGLVAHPWGTTDQQLLDEGQPEPMYPSE
jgi:hypothetical protein